MQDRLDPLQTLVACEGEAGETRKSMRNERGDDVSVEGTSRALKCQMCPTIQGIRSLHCCHLIFRGIVLLTLRARVRLTNLSAWVLHPTKSSAEPPRKNQAKIEAKTQTKTLSETKQAKNEGENARKKCRRKGKRKPAAKISNTVSSAERSWFANFTAGFLWC